MEAGSSRRIQILDGGMGATLDALGHDVSGPMWGAELLLSNPDAIRSVHQGYIDAGADIIETGTYQISIPSTFDPADGEEARRLMGIALDLAIASAHSASPRRKVALSIGPYGAICKPGQEYSGAYPPPCGPSSAAAKESGAEDERIKHALSIFHTQRLATYSTLAQFQQIDYIAFETVPVLTEIHAIRKAKGHYPPGRAPGEWWIVCPFPDGRFPPGAYPPQGDGKGPVMQEEVSKVVEAMLLPIPGIPIHRAPGPTGIGVNCTNPSFIPSLARAFSSALTQLRRAGKIPKEQEVSWVLYPNGGADYSPATKTWSTRDYDASTWARAVAAVAFEMEQLEVDGRRVWNGVIVGGCCKASFPEIRALRDIIRGGEDAS